MKNLLKFSFRKYFYRYFLLSSLSFFATFFCVATSTAFASETISCNSGSSRTLTAGTYNVETGADGSQFTSGADLILNKGTGSACTFTISLTQADSAISLSSLTIQDGVTLTHSVAGATASTYNQLKLTITNTLTVESGGTIDVTGKGYLGGYQTGNDSSYGRSDGNVGSGYGSSSGGSHGGYGAQSNVFNESANTYDYIPAPVQPGGGGGGTSGNAGGNGGGVIIISATDMVITGHVVANGGAGSSSYGGGAGGTIYLTASGTISGVGNITANGGSGYYAGGGGYVALYYNSFTNSGTVTANGYNGSYGGGPGIVFKKATGSNGDIYIDAQTITQYRHLKITSANDAAFNGLYVQGYALLYVDSTATDFSLSTMKVGTGAYVEIDPAVSFSTVSSTGLYLNGGKAVFDGTLTLGAFDTSDGSVTGTLVTNGTTYISSGTPILGNGLTWEANSDAIKKEASTSLISLTIKSGGILSHTQGRTSSWYDINLTLSGALSVESGGTINVDSKGYVGGYYCQTTYYSDGTRYAYCDTNYEGRTGASNTTTGGSGQYEGGSHGGKGGQYYSNTVAETYDSITNPVYPGGSGGGTYSSDYRGSPGGGAVIINAASASVEGIITADGGSYLGGGGAGGSVNITVSGALSGGGNITADGGASTGTSSGGGGRISLKYGSYSHTGSVTAYGGNSSYDGAAGTIYKKSSGSTYGDLIINNNSLTNAYYTTSLASTASAIPASDQVSAFNNGYVFNSVTASNYGVLNIPGGTGGLDANGTGGEDTSRAFRCLSCQADDDNLTNGEISYNTSLISSAAAADYVCVGINYPPSAPTSLYMNDTTAQSGATNPTGITDTTPAFSAVVSDTESDNLTKARIQVSTVSDFSDVIWDSGASGTAITPFSSGSRSSDIVYASFGDSPTAGYETLLADGTQYYWRIKFWDSDTGEGAWSTGGENFTMFLTIYDPAPPTATAISPSQTTAGIVTFSTTIQDINRDASSLALQYSINGTDWISATLGTITPNNGSVETSTGSITGIDTDTYRTVSLTIKWNIEADLPNTDDTSVYFRITPSDTGAGTAVDSSAFAIDTQDPTAPGALTSGSATSSSVTLNFPSTLATDTNFSAYKIYYATHSSVTESDTAFTSSNDSDLGSRTFNSTTTTTISSLSSSTTYYFKLFAYDSWGNSTSSSEVSVATSAAAVSYCEDAISGSSYYEWISGVTVGSYTKSSGGTTHSDYTSETVSLTPGATTSVTVNMGYSSSAYYEHVKIWIDYNQDGDFDDTGENVFSSDGTYSVSGSFVVASATGSTRMRVMLNYSTIYSSCGSFSFGEVEDYTVQFASANTAPVISSVSGAQQADDGYVNISYILTDANSENDILLSSHLYSLDNSDWSQPMTTVSPTHPPHSGTSALIGASGGTTNYFVWNACSVTPAIADSSVYVRLTPNDGVDAGSAATSTVFAVDCAAPTISSRATKDLDGDGFIDAIYITFSENIDDTYVTASNFTIGAYTGSTFSTGDTTDDDDIYITFTDGVLSTSATPNVTYTAGTLKDLYANSMASNGPTASTDGAGPVITSAVADDDPSRASGIDSDDTVTITFNENTNQPTINASNIATALGLSSSHSWKDGANAIHSASWTNATTLVITLSVGTSLPTVAVGDTITLGSPITDSLGNTPSTATFSAITGSFTENSTPVISAVSAAQQTNDGYVNIGYTLTDADNVSNILLSAYEYSFDGSSWEIPPMTAATGDSAHSGIASLTGISTGAPHTFVWNVCADIDSVEDDNPVWVRLTPNDGTAEGSPAESSSFSVDCSSPAGLSALTSSSHTTSSMTLGWTAVTEANFNHYEIWYGATQVDVLSRSGTATEWDNSYDVNLATRTTTSTTIIGLNPNVGNYYKIWAVDNYGREETIDGATVYNDANAPGTPTLSASSTSSITVAINPNENSSTTEYAIQVGSTYVQTNGSLSSSAVWQTSGAWGEKEVTGLAANTEYTVSIKAKNGDGDPTGFSTSDSVYTLANPVTGVSLSDTTTSSAYGLSLTWTNGTQNGIKIDLSSVDGDLCDSTYDVGNYNTTTSNPTSPRSISASANTCYKARIGSYNGDGVLNTDYVYSSGLGLTTPPAQPTGLTKSGASNSGISWTWTEVSGATNYKIYRSSDDTLIGETGNATEAYTQTTSNGSTAITANTQHTIYVRAQNSKGEGIASSTASAYANANAPSGMSHQESTQSINTIVWTWLSGGAQKDFYASMESGGNSGYITALLWSVGSLSTNTQYSAQVIARNAEDFPTSATSTNAYTSQGTPSGMTFSDVGTDTITVTAAGTFANLTVGSSGIRFQNSTTAADNTLQTQSWVNSSLSPNTQYTYVISGKNGDGTETSTVTSSKYTLAATPAIPTVDNASSTTLDVLINANGNPSPTQFAIYETVTGKYVQADETLGTVAAWQTVGTNSGKWGETTLVSGKVQVSGLTIGTNYEFKVKARNGEEIPTENFSPAASAYTLVSETDAPTVGNPSSTTLDVTINDDENPSDATYKIYESVTNKYVQADGTLGTDAVWQTSGAWGAASGVDGKITVTGLSVDTQYTFSSTPKSAGGEAGTTSVSSSKYTWANAPTTMAGSINASSGATITWAANGNPDSTVYYVEGTSGSTSNSGWTTALSWIDTLATSEGRIYCYTLKAKNGDAAETSSVTLSGDQCLTIAASQTGGVILLGGGGGSRKTPNVKSVITNTTSEETTGGSSSDISLPFGEDIIVIPDDVKSFENGVKIAASESTLSDPIEITNTDNSLSVFIAEDTDINMEDGKGNVEKFDGVIASPVVEINPPGISKDLEGKMIISISVDTTSTQEVTFSRPVMITVDLAKLNLPADIDFDKVKVYFYNRRTNAYEYISPLIVAPDGKSGVFVTYHLSTFTVFDVSNEETENLLESNMKFVDIQGHWAKEYIEKLYDAGIVSGRYDSRFLPSEEATRAELVKMALKAFGYEISENEKSEFKDVSEKHWAKDFINTAKDKEIIVGYEDGSFGPDNAISRIETLKILFKAAGIDVESMIGEGIPEAGFTDIDRDSWYTKILDYAVSKGIVSGDATGETFRPNDPITRGEASKMTVEVMEIEQ